MVREVKNITASVRTRLQNIARAKQANFQRMLTRYALERLLFRLSVSPHNDRFVLKGAMLYAAWLEDPFRTTRDLDLLSFGEPEAQRLVRVFREIFDQAVQAMASTCAPVGPLSVSSSPGHRSSPDLSFRSAIRGGALPNQLAIPAVATRRIFLWGDWNCLSAAHRNGVSAPCAARPRPGIEKFRIRFDDPARVHRSGARGTGAVRNPLRRPKDRGIRQAVATHRETGDGNRPTLGPGHKLGAVPGVSTGCRRA